MTETNATQAENAVTEEVKSDVKSESEQKPDGEGKTEEKKPWFQKRFDRFTAQNHALKSENETLVKTNEQLLAELTNLRAGKNEEGGKSNLTQAEIDRLAAAKAREIVAQERFNEKCNAVYEKGSNEFDDFSDAVKTLNSMGVMTPQFLELVTDLDASHTVIHHLGKNPEEADRIQAFSPAKQALALAKLETQLSVKPKKEEKPISNAPPPIKTVESKGPGSAGYATKYYQGMPQEEYNEWRDKTRRK